MIRVNVLPHSVVSNGARELTTSLRAAFRPSFAKVSRSNHNSPLNPNTPDRVVINWGTGRAPEWFNRTHQHTINQYDAVSRAGNKISSFIQFAGNNIPTPEFTADVNQAGAWLLNGHTVVARTVLRGHGGEGIVIVEPGQELPEAPLYTLYKKKRYEFRVHVFDNHVIDVQQKKHRREVEGDNAIDAGTRSKIRNLANGWVFCRENLNLNQEQHLALVTIAIQAVNCLGLHFGAVDVIYNQREDSFYVLEVNTAPGLEGQTLTNYTNAFVRYITRLADAR